MAITVALPSVSRTPARTVVAQRCIFAFQLNGTGTQENLVGESATFNRAISKLERKIANSSGVLIVDRLVVIDRMDKFTIVFDEFTAEVLAFVNAVQRNGLARLWFKDPRDAALTAALMTNEFLCTVTFEGDVALTKDNFSQATLTVQALADVTLSADASTTP